MSSLEIKLSPDLERFVEDQVRSGHFATPTNVVEEALTLLRELPTWTDASLREAIHVGIAQIESGQVAPWDAQDLKARVRNGIQPS